MKKILLFICSLAAVVIFTSCSHNKNHSGHSCASSCKDGACDYKAKKSCAKKDCQKCKDGTCDYKAKKSCDKKDCQKCKDGTCEYKKKSDCHKSKSEACDYKKKSVWFSSPKDNATVSKKVNIKFSLKGMQVTPAGKIIPMTGHHHLIVDGGPIEKGKVVPADAKHIHFGKGQVETDLNLVKGKHTLTLQFADGHHMSYGKEMSSTITVHVE